MSFTRIFSVVLALILPMKLSLADVVGQPRIIDGDTIEISGERIRLQGIDPRRPINSVSTAQENTGRAVAAPHPLL